MVTTGFSKPYIAKYSNTGTAVTYSDGMKLGRGVELKLDIDTADDNNFYADNVVAETETSQFTSGSVTTTVDGLEPAASAGNPRCAKRRLALSSGSCCHRSGWQTW